MLLGWHRGEVAATFFVEPCPEDFDEVYEFAQVVLDTIAKAAKASKKKADTYRTALMEGCFKDGQVQIMKQPKESDLDLVARVTMGLIRGGVDLERDKWLGVLWRLSHQ